MMYGVVGLPGAGKTTFLTAAAQKCLQGKSFLGLPARTNVFTNFSCPGCYKLDFHRLGRENITDALILIDEIALLADNRNWKNFSEDLTYFFSHYRHFFCDIIWCSQYWDADKKIDVRTDKIFILEKSAFLPVSWVKPILHELTVRCGQRVDGYRIGAPVTWRGIWRPRWYSYFDSYAQRELAPPTLELWECEMPDK